jgi:uncharacterized protein
MNEHTTAPSARPFSVWLYLCMVFGLSWPFQIASVIWGSDLFPVYVLNSTAMLMVTVGTYIAGRYVFRDGFAGAGWRWGKPRYYLAVVGLASAVWVVPTGLDIALGTLRLPPGVTPTQLGWVFVLLFVTLIPGFGEEFGWRGYLLPRLAERRGPRQAVFLHAVIWWAWHLPVLVGGEVVVGLAGVNVANLSVVGLSVAGTVLLVAAMSVIPTVLHGVVFAYIWSRTRSLAVATVYHGAYDGMRDSLATTIGLSPIAGVWATLLLVIVGLALLWKGNWSTLKVNTTVHVVKSSEIETPEGLAQGDGAV